MIKISATYASAVRYSHSNYARVDIIKAGTVVARDVPVVSGQVSADRGAGVRLNCDLVLANNPWDNTIPADVYSYRFRVYKGISSIGFAEAIQLGEYRMEQVTRADGGSLAIKGVGLESYVVDARFIRPRTAPVGTNAIAGVKNLIGEVVPHARFRNEITRNVLTPIPLIWDKDRRDAVDQLASSLLGEVYAGYDGVFVLKNSPSLSKGRSVYTINPGDGGLLTNQAVTNTRTGVYNAVVVTGKDPGNNRPIPYAFVSDTNPTSPTRYGGEFGQVPMFYTSQFLMTNAQCQSVANNLLSRAVAQNRQLTFGSSPVPFLEPGDVITVVLTNGTREKHLIEKMTISLNTSSMGMDTLATKIPIEGGG